MRILGCFFVFLCGASFLWAEEVPDSSWMALSERFKELKKDYKKEEKSHDSKKKSDQEQLTLESVAYLRGLLVYESAARLLLYPKDEVVGLGQHRELSSQEQRSIEKLRQEIREADRERILNALKDDADLVGGEKENAAILKDELKLDGLFKSNTRKITSEITKKERSLGKLIQTVGRDDPGRKKLEGEIAELKKKTATIHQAVFGFGFGSGFEEEFDSSLKGSGGGLLKAIILERDRVYKVLRGEEEEGGEGEGKAGVVGGSFVYSANLGVVLDTSGSMKPFLEDLREEIENYFEAPRYREVVGCNLNSCHFEHLRTTRGRSKWPTMSEMESLIAIHRVDTLYWFSDLKDAQDSMSIRRLRDLLMRGGTRLHVKSVSKEPSREFEKIIHDFQG